MPHNTCQSLAPRSSSNLGSGSGSVFPKYAASRGRPDSWYNSDQTSALLYMRKARSSYLNNSHMIGHLGKWPERSRRFYVLVMAYNLESQPSPAADEINSLGHRGHTHTQMQRWRNIQVACPFGVVDFCGHVRRCLG